MGFGLSVKWVRLFLRSLAFLLFLFSQALQAVSGESDTSIRIRTDQIKYFVPGFRINVSVDVSDGGNISSIPVARCYFRAAGEADFVFVKLTKSGVVPENMIGGKRFTGQLPAAGKDTESIEYLFLVVSKDEQVIKTQTFTVQQRAEEESPSWQQNPDGQDIQVYTELDTPPEQVAGFSDNVTLDVVESSARFGVVAGLYGSMQESAVGGATSTVAGKTAAGTGAAGTTEAGGGVAASSTASSTISTKTLAIAAAGVAVVVGGAAAAGGGGGGGGSSTNVDCNQFDGNWGGTWTGVDCDGYTENGPWSMTCTNCSCSAVTPDDNLSGTINGNSATLTGVGSCGNITAPATFNNDQVSGNYSYAYGGSGTFSGTRR